MSAHKSNELVAVSLWFQILFSYLSSIVLVIAGIAMLKGYEWGRSLITIWLLSASLATFLVAGFSYWKQQTEKENYCLFFQLVCASSYVDVFDYWHYELELNIGSWKQNTCCKGS